MRTLVSDATICTLPDFLAELGEADPMLLLAGFAGRSALLEQSEADGALESRLALAVLANGVLHVPLGVDRASGVRANYPRLLRLANGVTGDRSSLDLVGRALTELNCRNVVRMYAQHEALLGPLKPGLARTQMILGRILPSVLSGRPNPLDALERATGVAFPDVRAAFFALYARTLAVKANDSPQFVPRQFGATRKAEAFFQALLPFARTIRDLATLSTTSKAYSCGPGQEFRYAYSALRDYPLALIAPDVAVAPVARYLALLFSDGIYD